MTLGRRLKQAEAGGNAAPEIRDLIWAHSAFVWPFSQGNSPVTAHSRCELGGSRLVGGCGVGSYAQDFRRLEVTKIPCSERGHMVGRPCVVG